MAAEAARRAGAARVLIVDWDVHHGNGTQEIFAGRDDVLYMSVHQFPFYPGTGAAEEIGVGAGKGATVNCPLPAGQDDADYGAVFHDLFLPVGRAFAPDLIIVSAGYDAHARDPLAEMNVTERGFAAMTSALAELAERTCGGKLALLLEGGYDLGGAGGVGARVAGGAHRPSGRLPPRRRDRPGAGGGGGARRAPGRRAGRSQDVTMKALRWPPWTFGSGASVGALASRLLALIALAAWVSLGSQVRVLLGSRGLLPVGELMDAVRADGRVGLFDLPTLFWRFHSDGVLVGGTVVGAALAVVALCGWRPRLCFALSTALYLSYATVGRDFLSFQWDNLLLECGLLAAFLPTDRPAPLVHLLFRLVLFKLYFESGVAKWQSDLGDWQDGSAMTYYYETAPLPTWLAFTAHHLPVWWHHLESRATLVLELVVPFLIFGPRRARLFAAFVFSFFQICNAATANYGFFCYLAAALNVFLLDDVDVDRAGARAAKYLPSAIRRGVERLLSFRARLAAGRERIHGRRPRRP